MRLVKFNYINPEAPFVPNKPSHPSYPSINHKPYLTFNYIHSQSEQQCMPSFHKDFRDKLGNSEAKATEVSCQSRLSVSDVHLLAQKEAEINMQIEMLRKQWQQSRQEFAALLERKVQTRIIINSSLHQNDLQQMQLQTAFFTRQKELNSLRQLFRDIQYE